MKHKWAFLFIRNLSRSVRAPRKLGTAEYLTYNQVNKKDISYHIRIKIAISRWLRYQADVSDWNAIPGVVKIASICVGNVMVITVFLAIQNRIVVERCGIVNFFGKPTYVNIPLHCFFIGIKTTHFGLYVFFCVKNKSGHPNIDLKLWIVELFHFDGFFVDLSLGFHPNFPKTHFWIFGQLEFS